MKSPLLLLALFCAGSRAADATADDDDDQAASELETALNVFKSAAEIEDLVVNYANLVRKHGSAAALFGQYNRFQDASKSGEQALGHQEVRAMLKDIGLGNMAIRGEMANLATRVLDASGDGKVSAFPRKPARHIWLTLPRERTRLR